MRLTHWVNRISQSLGFKITRSSKESFCPSDFDPNLVETYNKVKFYTMTSPERIFSLCEAVRYVQENKIEGDIVECGVWKGGSMMAVAEALLRAGDISRDLYLFDTYDGMSSPTENDIDISGVSAKSLLDSSDKESEESIWCRATLEVVKKALETTGYQMEKIHFVKGMVEQTIPNSAPDKIALLRLDTDWYESTKHEMEHLFPRLSRGGVLIIDDYGHWQGARKAVDEYIKKNEIRILLNRIDYTGRIAVKVD
jgi:O-methyltransferase